MGFPCLMIDRVGSEFWKLAEKLGDEETGLQYVLIIPPLKDTIHAMPDTNLHLEICPTFQDHKN